MIKFKQVCSNGYQMSRGEVGGIPCLMSGDRTRGLMSDVRGGGLYSEVQYIMGNGRMGTPYPCGQTV